MPVCKPFLIKKETKLTDAGNDTNKNCLYEIQQKGS